MANQIKFTTSKGARVQGPQKASAPRPRLLKRGDPIPPEYDLQDNQDGSFTIFGKDSQGAKVDVTGLATLTPPPSSDNPNVLTVDAPAGMTVQCHGVLPGSATVTFTATFNDGSVGPFVIDVPATVAAGPVTGLGVDFGTPTVRDPNATTTTTTTTTTL